MTRVVTNLFECDVCGAIKPIGFSNPAGVPDTICSHPMPDYLNRPNSYFGPDRYYDFRGSHFCGPCSKQFLSDRDEWFRAWFKRHKQPDGPTETWTDPKRAATLTREWWDRIGAIQNVITGAPK